MTDQLKRNIAALIANSLWEQSQDTATFGAGYVHFTEDLTTVGLDGCFDLEAIAEAVITEVHDDAIANPDD